METNRDCATCANGSTRYEEPTCVTLSVFAANICRERNYSHWKPKEGSS